MDLIGVDRASELPLYQQIYTQLHAAILDGRIAPGTKLPSTRALATDLGLARIVVLEAYERLHAEGYTETLPGAGTFVLKRLSATLTDMGKRHNTGLPLAMSPAAGQVPPTADLFAPTASRTELDFRQGVPALNNFPRRKWGRTLADLLLTAPPQLFDYGPAIGCRELRIELAKYLGRARGLLVSPERIAVVSGTAQALDLITRTCASPGNTVAVEDPTSPVVCRAFSQAGANVLHIPVDEHGMQVDKLPYGVAAPRLVYVTPSHQFPTGGVMSLERRLRLLTWAEENGALIVEDDYDSEFRYEGFPIPSLAGLDRLGRVVYIGTFSKTMFPALRIAYVALPELLVEAFVINKWQSDRCSPAIEQLALADWLQRGDYEKHVRRMRAIYALRCRELLSSLTHWFGEIASVKGTLAGLHLYVQIHAGLSEEELIDRARHVGVRVYPASPCHFGGSPEAPALLFGYGWLELDQIRRGIALLADQYLRE